ncbi:hypothetical protein ACFPAF_09585 [Hymenobacter endophyticus]|uniref:Uncharacterized protein n=1 Tax=Hymenobacter endophyticus TaxID=3076335 RepID=A0ABU3TH04_9BACT|nr:hypothetical protein [Hymenobacter endophyticus]MDU0370642.1 hypothetical protein [Hymenobacter endophyticus]
MLLSRFLAVAGLLSLGTTAAWAQNRAPVMPTRHHPTERISPVPGVTLPSGVGQGKAEPLPIPTDVNPNGSLAQPKLPTGEVTVDSVQVTPQPRRSTPARRKRP